MKTGPLAGRKILVVEDEYFIASDLKRMLIGEGAAVVGPVGDLASGMSLAEEQLDAAVLDVNLENVMSFPIADRLQGRNVPYMFLTGYDGWALPPDYRDATCLAKPFATGAVVSMVEKLIASGPRGEA